MHERCAHRNCDKPVKWRVFPTDSTRPPLFMCSDHLDSAAYGISTLRPQFYPVGPPPTYAVFAGQRIPLGIGA